MATSETITVTILGRDYRLSCAPDEKLALLAAVDLVDRKMHEVRNANRVMSNDRIAVFAALNIANELLAARQAGGAAPPPAATPKSDLAFEEFQRRIQSIDEVLDRALAPQEKLF